MIKRTDNEDMGKFQNMTDDEFRAYLRKDLDVATPERLLHIQRMYNVLESVVPRCTEPCTHVRCRQMGILNQMIHERVDN